MAVFEKPDWSDENEFCSHIGPVPRRVTNVEVEKIFVELKEARTDFRFPIRETENFWNFPDGITERGNVERKGKVDAARSVYAKVVSPVENRNDKVNKTDEDEMEEYLREIIVHHKVSHKHHCYAKKGDTLYCIRWYGYEAEDDTREPTHHLSQSKVLNYRNWLGLDVPTTITNATDG